MKEHLDTYNFEYYPNESNEYTNPVRVSFDSNDLEFSDFCRMVKAFAYALGYAEETISKYFKDEEEEY